VNGRAKILCNRKATLVDYLDPEPKRRGVVVKIKAAGMCGSDLYLYRSSPEHLKEYYKGGVPPDEPKIPGHESCGVIEKIGKGCLSSVFTCLA
jgi:D-arabinose 1-dehydrogenase-like Zn-dependent alcohol dehydrogenase